MTDFIRSNVDDFDDTRRALATIERNRTEVDSSVSTLQSQMSTAQSDITALQTTGIVSIANTDSPYSVAATVDVILCDSNSGAIEIDLPAASGQSGRRLDIIRTSTGNNVTIDPNGSENIDGSSSSYTMTGSTADDKQISIICDGTEWWLTSRD